MKRSCPFFAEASEAAFAERSTRLMWSTMTFVSCFCPHCLQKVPSNQVSYAGTKWLHWSIFSVFCCAAAVSGNRKNGPEPTPAARAPVPVHLMKSRRDSPSCFFFAILLPSEKQTGPGKLTPRMGGAFRPDDAPARAGESTCVARLLHISDLVPDHRADGGGKNYSPNAEFGGTAHGDCVCWAGQVSSS